MSDAGAGPELVRNPAAAGFAADYEAAADALAPFYAGHPSDPDAFRRKAQEVERRFDAAARARLREMLRPVSREAAARLDAVASGRGFVVTTGQQAGAFAGPLFALYKALSAAALADALQELLGVPVLAVFWTASEDHDWAEVKDLHLLDTGNELHRFELADTVGEDGTAPGRSMARRPLDPEHSRALIERVRELLPPTAFLEERLDAVRAAYATDDATVSGAFEALLASMCAGAPLAMVQASDAALKQASIPVLRAELERGSEHEALLRARAVHLEAAGYEPQVQIQAGAENVFHESDAGRERLLRTDDGWVTRGRGIRLTRATALAELEREPARFSPNVLLRPVVESAVLPTLAYVAGPAEVRYFAQIGCLFEAHGIGMPLVVPRASFTVVEWKTRKVLDKFGFDIADLAAPPHEVANRVIAREMPADVAGALGRLRGALDAEFGVLAGAVKQIDPTLEGPVGGARSDSFAQLDRLEKRVMRALRKKHEIALRQIGKARSNLFPDGKPQERVLNPLQYLVRYGDAFVQQIREAIRYRIDAPRPTWRGVRCP